MTFATALLTPLVLLMPAAGAVEANRDMAVVQEAMRQASPELPVQDPPQALPDVPDFQPFSQSSLIFASQGFRPDSAYQVRIERRMTIRIAPRARRVEPNAFIGVPSRPIGPDLVERRIGRCLPVARIAGVQANRGNTILLYMQDRRVVRADLERTCRARDFYSGFYLSRSDDGKLCVQRDALQSRSGAKCKLTRIRQLVELDD